MALGDYVVETPERRQASRVVREWGTGTEHSRIVTVPYGRTDTELGDAFAKGAVIPQRFWKDGATAPGTTAAVPRLIDATWMQEKPSARQEIRLRYLEMDVITAFSSDYAETRRVRSSQQYTVETSIYGIALTITSGGIPTIGDFLDGGSGLAAVCSRVDLDDRSYPGRVLVLSNWTQLRAYV